MKTRHSRRNFLQTSLAASLAAPLLASHEEHALLARADAPPGAGPSGGVPIPSGTIGKVRISRLICGGNLISGYAHSRDLIYVSKLLTAYFTDEKIQETWALCEQHGINTMIFNPSDRRALELFRTYIKRGGKIQCLAQLSPEKDAMDPVIQEAVDAGVVGALLVGNAGDAWARSGAVDKIGEFVAKVQAHGIIAGVAGHELRTPMAVEKAGIQPDFYMKTLHSNDYWSKRRPDQTKDVIDNYGADNYWCMDAEATIEFMRGIKRPWLAYKVLAAGAIHPGAGFKYAFEKGADFCVVGMFDFQITEDARIANEAVAAAKNRPRPWVA